MPLHKLPDNCHPLVARMFAEMRRQQITYAVMSKRSGINISTFENWRTITTPNVANLEACLNVLGLTLTIEELK